jgi:hypothetical protein
MASDLLVFLIGLAALAIILERVVEWLFGWLPDVLKKSEPIRSKKRYRENVGKILTLIVLLLGWMASYQGNFLILKELFLSDTSKAFDSFVTGLCIAVGADVFHQLIRAVEEKKERTKEARIITKVKWYRKRKSSGKTVGGPAAGIDRRRFR